MPRAGAGMRITVAVAGFGLGRALHYSSHASFFYSNFESLLLALEVRCIVATRCEDMWRVSLPGKRKRRVSAYSYGGIVTQDHPS